MGYLMRTSEQGAMQATISTTKEQVADLKYAYTGDHEDTIRSLPDPRYDVIQPILIQLKRESPDNWIARFEEGNISMSGTSPEDAKQSLADDIVYALDLFLSESGTLSPVLTRELCALKQHVRVSQ